MEEQTACDNQAVVEMINKLSSSCKNCMVLLRKLVHTSLENNFCIFVKFVSTVDNDWADALSRGQMSRFRNICKQRQIRISDTATSVPDALWPVEKFWIFE